MTSAITYRGAVLQVEFADSRPGEMMHLPLNYHETRELAALVERNGGMTVETTPKRLVAFFPRAAEALAQARAALARIDQAQVQDPARNSLSVRALLAFGTVTIQGGRLRSSWTLRLPELAAQVPNKAIAATRDFIGQFEPGALPDSPRSLPSGELFLLFAGSAGETGETRLASALNAADAGVFTVIALTVRGARRLFRAADCPLTLGRDATCSLPLKGDTTSRVHGRIEFFNDKFHYIDDSRNGSWVLTAAGEELHLTGEKIVLVGDGAISPGAPLKEQSGEVVRYACNSTRLSIEDEETQPL